MAAKPLVVKSLWPLDPDLTYLNHGSFGATPKPVLREQERLRLLNERNPVNFALRETHGYVEAARIAVANLVNADERGIVLCGNATEAVNTVLRGQDWQAGDEILMTSHGYPACWNTVQELSKRYGVVAKLIDLPYPDSLSSAADFNAAVIAQTNAALSSRSRILLVDHISSPTALIFPVAELIKLARSNGTLSLIDGAHVPGQLPLSIAELMPDFYVGNLHKWLFVPRAVSFLWVKEDQRQLLPLVISHGYNSTQRFQDCFSWTGTRDLTARMCVPTALDFIEEHIGGLTALMQHNHQLICAVKNLMAEHWWPNASDQLPTTEILGAMLTLPLPPRITTRLPFAPDPIRIPAGTIHPLQNELFNRGFEVPIITWRNGLCSTGEPTMLIRVAAQVYCCLEDYQRLLEAIDDIVQ